MQARAALIRISWRQWAIERLTGDKIRARNAVAATGLQQQNHHANQEINNKGLLTKTRQIMGDYPIEGPNRQRRKI